MSVPRGIHTLYTLYSELQRESAQRNFRSDGDSNDTTSPVCGHVALAALAFVYDMQLDTQLRLPLHVMEDRFVEHHFEGVQDTGPHHQDQVLLCLSKTATNRHCDEPAP